MMRQGAVNRGGHPNPFRKNGEGGIEAQCNDKNLVDICRLDDDDDNVDDIYIYIYMYIYCKFGTTIVGICLGKSARFRLGLFVSLCVC